MNTVEMHKEALRNIKSYLKKNGRKINQVSSSYSKARKVDFILDGAAVKFKTCSNNQVNILFEVINGRNAGWFKATEAKSLLYYIQEPKLLYIIDIDKTRSFIEQSEVKRTSKGMNGGGLCYMIPIKDLKMNGLIKEILYV